MRMGARWSKHDSLDDSLKFGATRHHTEIPVRGANDGGARLNGTSEDLNDDHVTAAAGARWTLVADSWAKRRSRKMSDAVGLDDFELPPAECDRGYLALRRVFLSVLPVMAERADVDLTEVDGYGVDFADRAFPPLDGRAAV
jgi:hypothetical protein